MNSIFKNKTVKPGKVFKWKDDVEDWVYTLFVDSYHMVQSRIFNSEDAARKAMVIDCEKYN